jgi:hypothetical protein
VEQEDLESGADMAAARVPRHWVPPDACVCRMHRRPQLLTILPAPVCLVFRAAIMLRGSSAITNFPAQEYAVDGEDLQPRAPGEMKHGGSPQPRDVCLAKVGLFGRQTNRQTDRQIESVHE